MGSIKDTTILNTISPETIIPAVDVDYPNYKNKQTSKSELKSNQV